jgi:hypothetical protein
MHWQRAIPLCTPLAKYLLTNSSARIARIKMDHVRGHPVIPWQMGFASLYTHHEIPLDQLTGPHRKNLRWIMCEGTL